MKNDGAYSKFHSNTNILSLPNPPPLLIAGLHAWLNGKEDVSGESQVSKVVGSNSGSFNSNNKLEIIRRARMTTKELHQRRLKFLSTSLACMGSYSQHRVLLSKQVRLCVMSNDVMIWRNINSPHRNYNRTHVIKT